jgi:hypothetical protein
MASGDTLAVFVPHGADPLPASGFPQLDVRNNHPVLDYDAAVDETAYWTGVLPGHYSGGGLVVAFAVAFSSDVTTTNTARVEVAIERLDSAGQDLDVDGFAAAKSTSVSPQATLGALTYGSVTFANGAEMDNLAANEWFRLMFRRDADGTTGTDNSTGDMELVGIQVREA